MLSTKITLIIIFTDVNLSYFSQDLMSVENELEIEKEKEKEKEGDKEEKQNNETHHEPMETEQSIPHQPPKLFPVPDDKTLKIVFAGNIKLDRTVWNVRDTKIAWQTGANLSLDEQTEEIISAIRDPQPKHIAVICFQQYLPKHKKQEIYERIQTITDLASKSSHIKLVFGTMIFIPELENLWRDNGDLNDFIRLKNIRDLDTSPLSVHKSLMVSKKGCLTQQVKGKYWKEFEEGQGVGLNLSFDGMVKLAKWIIRHFDTAFTEEDRPKGVNHLKELIPKPLKFTPCYSKSPKMMTIINTKSQSQNRSRYTAPKKPEIRRHSTGAQEPKGDKRGLPRHVSYNGSDNKSNIKVTIEAQESVEAEKVDKKEERTVVELDTDEEEEDEKVEVLMSDLKDLYKDFQQMESDREEYKSKILALESLNKKQTERLELIEAETEGNMKDIKWFQKKLIRAEQDLEEMTMKYATQAAIQDEVTKFTKFFSSLKKESKKMAKEEKERKKND